MNKKVQEMASRLRNNRDRNLRDYEKQSREAEERIANNKKLAHFVSTVKLRRKHF